MYLSASPRERVVSALASGTVVAVVIYALIMGLAYDVVTHGRDALISVFTEPSKPPPQPQAKREERRSDRPAAKDEASPRNLRNQATPIVAPPVVPLILPPPVVAATQAGTGQAAQTGASDRPGPGRGAGGLGDGTGGGGQGGDGDGVAAVGPRQIRGRLSFNDLPQGLLSPGNEASVGVRYMVERDGRVSACRATESSGYAQIDATACRLIEQRFRFKPARDREGNPVRASIVETHSWYLREED